MTFALGALLFFCGFVLAVGCIAAWMLWESLRPVGEYKAPVEGGKDADP